MSGGRGECGARGSSLISLTPGRSGHHVCRHYDRHARCVAGSGQIRRRSDPRPLDGLAHETWPGSHQGTTHPLGRAEVERRQASAPDSGRRGASRSFRGALRTRLVRVVRPAFAGVPLPSFIFVIARSGTSNPNRHDARSLQTGMPRSAADVDCFASLAMTRKVTSLFDIARGRSALARTNPPCPI